MTLRFYGEAQGQRAYGGLPCGDPRQDEAAHRDGRADRARSDRHGRDVDGTERASARRVLRLRCAAQPHLEPRWPIGAKLRLRPALDASATARIGPAEPRTRARKASATARLTPRTRARSASDIGNSDPVFHVEGVQQGVSKIDAENFVIAFPETFWTGVADLEHWLALLLAEGDAASRTLKPSPPHPWSLGLWFRRWCTWSPVVHVVTEVYARSSRRLK